MQHFAVSRVIDVNRVSTADHYVNAVARERATLTIEMLVGQEDFFRYL